MPNEGMTKYDVVKTQFEHEYRDFIDSYISQSMTCQEEQSICQLQQHQAVNYSDMHELVKDQNKRLYGLACEKVYLHGTVHLKD